MRKLKPLQLIPIWILMVITAYFGWQALPAETKELPKATLFNALNIPYNKPLHFVVMGDWGSGLKPQYEVAEAMYQKYQEKPFDFLVTLGDNIYPLGDIKGGYEKKFALPYEKLLKTNIPWYVALGNHDAPDAKKQVEFFHMPSRYYTFTQGPVQFFVLDTNIFYPYQQDWLNQQLSTSKAHWKVVVGHHPIYSTGAHGMNKHLLETLAPILEANKVDLYLAGHDHGYERFDKINGVQYIISGGGGASIRQFEFDGSLTTSKVRISDYHFLVVDASWKEIKINATDRSLNTIDTLTLTKN